MRSNPAWPFPLAARSERPAQVASNPAPAAAGADAEDQSLSLRRAFRTPPPLMGSPSLGSGWKKTRDQS